MPSTSTSLYDLAAELLTQSAAILGSDAPAIQYVSVGPPAADCCGILTVDVGTLTYGPFNADVVAGDAFMRADQPVINLVPLNITHLMCANAIPQGGTAIRLPAATKMTQDSQNVYTTMWTLWNGLRQSFRDGSLFAGFPCRPWLLGGATPISPEGGCLGYGVTVIVSLDGFDP